MDGELQVSSLFDPFAAMQFDDTKCFLCGEQLTSENRTEEHIFPKWLQQKYGLWTKTLVLLNRTRIPYRQLTIPCCRACNSGPLSSLEREVAAAVDQGIEAFRQLGELKIFQWVSKIFYGLLFKELFLRMDRASGSLETIVSPEVLESLRMCHVFLQSVRIPIDFAGFQPWSLHLVKLQVPNETIHRFDYRDSLMTLTFAIRMDDIGLIMCLQDNGTHYENYAPYFEKFQGRELHRMQFLELAAKVFYKSGLLNRTPKYITMIGDENMNTTVLTIGLQGWSSTPVYDEWDQRTYAQILAQFSGVPFEQLFREPGLVLSLLEREDGTFNEMKD